MFEIFGYILVMLAVIVFWFSIMKRPIYESILVSFVVMLTITGNWPNLLGYVTSSMSKSLLYSMMAFTAMSQILSKTRVIDDCVLIIIALFGRIPGGAGYAAVAASSFMGAFSGSGPANVMATGSITIPAMIRSGYPREVAANIESTSSYLGNMIPPSANIVAALGAFLAVYPDSDMTTGSFWIVCWGVSLWFILSRFIVVFIFCKYYNIRPMDKADVPDLKQSLRDGWRGLILPVIILLPFMFDSVFNGTFVVGRLGTTGAKYFSSSLLVFVAGVAVIYGILIAKDKKEVTPVKIIGMFANGVKSLAPTVGTCLIGYMIGELFTDLDMGTQLQMAFKGWNIGAVGLAIIIPLATCFLSMVIPGSSIVVMLGSVFISAFAAVGVDPLLVAAMLPCICGVMGGITPPFALGMYAGMTIAKSDFTKTLKNGMIWVVVQYVLEVIVLLGWLPVFGLA